MEKTKLKKILLIIILVLISIQIIYAGYQNLPSAVSLNTFPPLILTIFILLIGIFFLISAILILKEKNWIKKPLMVVLALFILYCIYTLINTFLIIKGIANSGSPYNQKILSRLLIWQIFLTIEYIVLGVLGLILNWKYKENKTP
jgi:uncharacterized membrane protein YozB (DUF420 family)